MIYQCVCACSVICHVWLFLLLWAVAYQAPLSMGFSRQEYQSGLPCPPPEDLTNPGIKPASLMSSALAGGFFTTSATWVKVAQSCLTLCNPMDYTVHRILQARILEWVAFPFSRGSSQPRDQTQVSYIAGRFITSWATREVQSHLRSPFNHHVTITHTGLNKCNRLSQFALKRSFNQCSLYCPYCQNTCLSSVFHDNIICRIFYYSLPPFQSLSFLSLFSGSDFSTFNCWTI